MGHARVIAFIIIAILGYFLLAYPASSVPKGGLFFLIGIGIIVLLARSPLGWVAGSILMAIGYFWPMLAA